MREKLKLQSMAMEFSDEDFRVHIANLKGIQKSMSLMELLPFSFNRSYLATRKNGDENG